MDWHTIGGIVAWAIAFFSTIPYLYSIFYGTTRPSVISQILWALFVFLALAAQYAAGGFSWSMATGIATGMNNLILIIICLYGYGYRGHTWVDWVSGAIAIVGFILWQITKIPEIAIIFAIIASIAAGLPTYRKTYRFPQSDYPLTWFLIFVSAVISLIAAPQFTVATTALLIFFIVEALMMTWFTLRKLP